MFPEHYRFNKMKNIILSLLLPALLASCKNSTYNYSDKETQVFLDEITKNIQLEVGYMDPLDELGVTNILLLTRYPLSDKQYHEFNTIGYIKENNEDIADSVSCRLKLYELINQDNEKVELVFINDNILTNLQKYALIHDASFIYQDLGLDLTVNKPFEELNGYIIIEFVMPNNITREVKIPVNISLLEQLFY